MRNWRNQRRIATASFRPLRLLVFHVDVIRRRVNDRGTWKEKKKKKHVIRVISLFSVERHRSEPRTDESYFAGYDVRENQTRLNGSVIDYEKQHPWKIEWISAGLARCRFGFARYVKESRSIFSITGSSLPRAFEFQQGNGAIFDYPWKIRRDCKLTGTMAIFIEARDTLQRLQR